MTDSGLAITLNVRAMRRFFTDVASLLQTGARMLAERGWTSCGNVAYAGGSGSIDAPHLWLPSCAFRFLLHEEHERVLAMLSVVLDDPRDVAVDQRRPPMACAGAVIYRPGHAPASFDYNDTARMYLSTGSREMDGVPRAVDVKGIDPKGGFGVDAARALAVPLVEIDGDDAVAARLVTPLVSLVEELERRARSGVLSSQ